MIKIVCVIFVLLPQTPDGKVPTAKFEKEFHSLQECFAWKHQQAYAPVNQTQGGTLYFCEKYLEIWMFKVGDKVRNISSGNTYTIKEINEHNGILWLVFRYQQRERWFNSKYFELLWSSQRCSRRCNTRKTQ